MSIEGLVSSFFKVREDLMSIDKRVSPLFKHQDEAVVLPL